MSRIAQRVIGAVVLLGAGTLSLPVAETFLDGWGKETLVAAVQAGAMALIGAVCGLALPALAPTGASASVRALAGAGWGLLAALIGLLVFWVLLHGLV